MEKKGLSQEGLKLIACLAMLIDHVGATLVPLWSLRVIGRIAFPIFCFLLAEGAHYTRSPGKYALRLAVGVLLSEIPFDFALFGGWTWDYQSVMVTMLLGYCALWLMGKCPNVLLKCLAVVPFYVAAELLRTDYGGPGVLLIALFALTRELPRRWIFQTVGMGLLIWFLMPGARLPIFGVWFPVELFAVGAMVPIACYRGGKRTHSRAVQWGFYLFYPGHLAVLWLLQRLL